MHPLLFVILFALNNLAWAMFAWLLAVDLYKPLRSTKHA